MRLLPIDPDGGITGTLQSHYMLLELTG